MPITAVIVIVTSEKSVRRKIFFYYYFVMSGGKSFIWCVDKYNPIRIHGIHELQSKAHKK